MTGVLIMAGAVLQMMLFLWAAARRSYMAVALPVMAALAAISALAFWIGWTMFSTESELEEELEGEEAIP
jgi:CHASE2 domain-containing sensor protein